MGQSVLSATELSGFCAQMAMLLKAGIAAREGLAIMHDDISDNDSRLLLEQLSLRVEEGCPLSAAFEKSGVFPKYVVDMTEIGEQSGRLDEVLESLTAYYEREQSISTSIRNAVTYPLIMLGMMVTVIIVLAVRVMPIFNDVFAQLGAEMSAFAQGVMSFGNALGRSSTTIVAALAVLIVSVLFLRMTAKGRRYLSLFFARFPLTKRLSMKIAVGRFAGAMALMLQSGLDPDQSLNLAGKLVNHPDLTARIKECQNRVAAGSSFSDGLFSSKIFSGVYARMVSVGFRTGAADTIMRHLSDRSEEEIDAELNTLVSIVEPTLVAVLSVAVGLILLSVMLPLMGIMSTIG